MERINWQSLRRWRCVRNLAALAITGFTLLAAGVVAADEAPKPEAAKTEAAKPPASAPAAVKLDAASKPAALPPTAKPVAPKSAAAPPTQPAPKAAPTPLTFEQHVRPLLKQHCFQCHGEEPNPEGSLDLRLVRTMTTGGDSGAAIAPGKASASLLIEKLRAGEMPPGEKKLPAAEIDRIARWIDGGAKTARPEPAALSHDDITDEERQHWSFQPVKRPEVPKVKHGDLVRTPVDAFLLAKLEEQGVAYSPTADKRTLVRRVYFDLWGVPPTPDQVDEFLADTAPDAWDRLVDRLLASPHYGERWGRLWLDVAGYADSDGASEKDIVRQYAYKYRDYVIRSINSDKPFDEFIREQVAGDEMLAPPYTNLTPAQTDRLVATGFLRMGPDGTGAGEGDQNVARNEVMAETIKIVSTSLLGMTVGCAQCHSHRYEPISQADYYRFRAIFEPAYDWKNWRSPQGRLVSLMSDAQRKQMAEVDAEAKKLSDERLKTLQAWVDQAFDEEIVKIPEDQREALRATFKTPADKRTPEQKQLVRAHPQMFHTTGSIYLRERKRYNDFDKKYTEELAKIKARRPAEQYAQALTEVPNKTPDTFLFFRGDINQPREKQKPAELTILGAAHPVTIADDDAKLPTSGRRLAYAKHLTDGKHPLLARVLVNRVWLNHFGRGIVSTPADFGVAGMRPSHPELLDWLASEWMAGGWRLKTLHKLLLTSTAYQQVSARTPELDKIDVENRLLGRMNIRRLEAEMVRDAILDVAGSLNNEMFGPAVPVSPDDVGQIIVAVDTRDSAGRPSNKKVDLGDDVYRRSVYVQVRRSMPLSMLDTFDMPRLAPNCELRNNSTVAPQSLLLLNNTLVLDQSLAFARRVRRAAPNDVPAQVRLAWQWAFADEPTKAELDQAVAFINEQIKSLSPSAPAPAKPATVETPAKPAPVVAKQVSETKVAAEVKKEAPKTEAAAKPQAPAPAANKPEAASKPDAVTKPAAPPPATAAKPATPPPAAKPATPPAAPAKKPVADPAETALATFCQALLCSNRFLYID
ncbi:MAG: PSD1 domain-containing protein [Planctomycetes bacterium]|nr:PSD1 domain-containing protein [Planctomycetota bacterium]